MRAERLLDANLNRAREGLRTLEELARLILEDADLAESFRTRRRRLGELGEAQLPDLLPQRSAATDPGLAPEVAAGPRRDLSGVAAAAAGRVGESLRVLEEVGSTVSPAFSAGIQAIRHGWYDLDRDLRLRLGARAPVVQPRLCVLLTRDLCPRGDWVRIVDALAEAGVDMVQIREKSCSDGELLRHADAVRSRLPSSTRLVVNDRVG
ncbi:MAG: thiamine phosphate synthase, partial [Planctomycetota bacterium]